MFRQKTIALRGLTLCMLATIATSTPQTAWPPSGPGTAWPPANNGQVAITGFEADPEYADATGAAAPLPLGYDSSGEPYALETIVASIEALGGTYTAIAGEIRDAHASGAFVFVAIRKNDQALGFLRHVTGCIGMVFEDRSPESAAATLVHEWTHARRRAGHDDGTPNTHEEEDGPCGHIYAVLQSLSYLAARDVYEQMEGLPPSDICAKWRADETKCITYWKACKEAGGSPPNCLSNIPYRCL